MSHIGDAALPRGVSAGQVCTFPSAIVLGVPARLVFIQTWREWQGRGYGRELLEAFIDRVGHGGVVTSEIVHCETWSALRESDVLEKTYAWGKVWIRNKDRLMELPIVRFLESSGMDIG